MRFLLFKITSLKWSPRHAIRPSNSDFKLTEIAFYIAVRYLLQIEPTWRTNFLIMFIAFLYMFRATMCPSSGGKNPYLCETWYLSLYAGCNRRNGPDFGRVFLMLNYTEKHLYPKFNGYGDIGQRKVWTALVSAYCTLSVTSYTAYLGDGPRLLLLHSYVIARYS